MERTKTIIKRHEVLVRSMGPVRIREVEDAQRNITEIAQTLEEQEEISLSRSAKDAMLE